MRKIRVTVGTVGYYDAKHAHKRMTAADGPFECEDTQAAWLMTRTQTATISRI